MAVPLTLSSVPAQTPYVQYIATGGQTVFPYPFEITQDSDLVVLLNAVQQPTDGGYTLSGQGATGGGNVTFTVGLAASTVVTFYRNIPIARITQLSQNGTFFSSNFNNEYNRIYLIMQQLQESLLPGGNQAFALMVPNSNNPAPTTLLTPASYANKYLSFDGNGNPVPAALVSGTLTSATIGSLTYPITTAETAAGFTTGALNLQVPYGNMLRYGIVPNSTTAGPNNLLILQALFNPAVAGPTGEFVFPPVIGNDVYTFGIAAGATPTVPVRPYVKISGHGVTINVLGSSTANDVNVGFLYPLSDFIADTLTINSTVNTSLGTNSGGCIYVGARGAGHYYTVEESLLTIPFGRVQILNCQLSVAGNTGGQSAPPITMLGGQHESVIENNTLNCGSLGAISGFYYEFGYWSGGGGTVPSVGVVTTAARNLRLTNNTVLNCAGPAIGITGAYSFHVDGLYTNSSVQGFVYSVGQSMFFNPSPNDTAGQKWGGKVSRVVVQGCSAGGIVLNGANVQAGLTAQQQTDLMTFEVDNCSVTSSSGCIVIGASHTVIRNSQFNSGGTGTNPVTINDDCISAKIDHCNIIGGTGAGIRADLAGTGVWSPVRQKTVEVTNCLIAGNLFGMELNNVGSAYIARNRIGYNALFDGAGNEATQSVGVLVDSGCNGVICDSNTVTTASSGNAYQITGVASSGCNVVNPILVANGTITTSGNWDINGVSQASSGSASTGGNAPGIANKTSYPNLGYKYAGKMVLNSSNGVLYVAAGSASTSNWVPVYGTSLFATVTPA